ncbi:MAG: ABC transporter ATP-binding protein [Chloroflexi bacterium 13_1_40CM_4_68_4]|nr:MAG: ABC transporter ATP-binding protein [Chloroflexi bacterium 13_1_40CM_4_68_4]
MIEAHGWGWRHAGRKAWAVRGLDLRIEDGERVLLLGASGAGKSTLLLALAGLLDRSGGGESEGELRVRGLSPEAARGETGIVFQDPETQLVMARASDDVAFGLENRCVPTARIWPAVHAALAAVAFPYPGDRRTEALSGGEKQRLAIAGALALSPRLLLLDEPTANLDPEGAADVRGLIARLEADRDRTLVLVEHRVAESLGLVDRVIVIAAGGGVIADGTPGEIFAREGARLAALGVWVPGPAPAAPPRSGAIGHVLAEGRDLAFRYPASDTFALDGVDVTVRAGEAVAVTGPNGSGKSTLALLIAGLLRPARGESRLGDDDAWRLPARRLVSRAGTVFQDPEHQFVATRVDAELAIGPRRAGRSEEESRRIAAALLERLGLARLAAANPFTLSGGEQRRLSVATALAASPPLLVLDEPTFGQDRHTYAQLVALLAQQRDAGGAVLFASHDQDLVAGLADRTVTLRAGRLAA